MEVLIQNPGEAIRPIISSVQITNILTELYGLNPLEWTELVSYEDRNFHIQNFTIQLDSHIKEVWTYGYILKILNSLESQNPNLIDAQNQLMINLQNHGIRCPIPVQNVCNKSYALLDLTTMKDVQMDCKSEKGNIVRLFKFIPGQILASTEYTIDLFNDAGKYLCELHQVMKNFHHPEFDARQTLWSIPSFPHVTKFLYVVENPAHVEQVHEIIKEFQDKVAPRYNELPKGLIHGDFNENNILIEKQTDGGNVQITGILDFADVQYSCYAFDIAIAIMYLMLDSNNIDITAVGGHFLAGYCTKRTLDDSEWEVLKICVAARFCVSLVMGLYTNSIDSKNDYVLLTHKKGWQVLETFWAVPEKKLLNLWKNIQTTTKL